MAGIRGSLRQRLGWRRESDALRFLQRQGLLPIERNFHCRGGEIDLVMRDGDVLVSIEVRYRASRGHGGAIGSIDGRKCRRWMLATRVFLAARPEFADYCVRFDVVAFDGEDRREITWLRDVLRPD